MCGIFGLITTLKNKNIYEIIINGLIQLQNRGYDSSGICLLKNNDFEIHKYASTNSLSSIDKLLSLNLQDNTNTNTENNRNEMKVSLYFPSLTPENTNSNTENINIGIGHNRWATHGGKTDNNAHPHISNDKQFVLVHNGIIENYQELKQFLSNKNFTFYSETDTEIIVNLISYYYQEFNNTFKAIEKTISTLQGTYGIIVINKSEHDTLYAVRNGSPLLVGYTDNYAIITSEQSGFCNMVNTYITLNNDDICVIKNNKESENINKIIVETTNNYVQKNITINNFDMTPHPYKHWTIKEINDQHNTIFNAINRGGRIKNNCEVKLGGLEQNIDKLKDIKNIILLGCGTSYHAALYGAYYLKTLCSFNTVQVFDGADLNDYDIPRNESTAFILISQSGETKDLHRCIEIAQKHNIITIGIINVVDSLIAREVNCGIYCNAGREMGVASTKAFTSQIICLSMMAVWFAQINKLNENKRIKIIKDLHNLANDFKNTIKNIDNEIKKLSIDMINYNNIFILGKGTDEYIAKEGSLKIKEISYIHTEGYSTSSLKHGPFALLDENFPTIIINCVEEYNSKTLNCFEEVYARKSPIILITNNNNFSTSKNCKIINISKNNSYSSLIGIIPFQLLAYYLSIHKNINPDIPKNLAKVVTVE